MKSNKQKEESCGCEHNMAKKITKFVKKLKESVQLSDKYSCRLNKQYISELNEECLNKKALVQYISENRQEIKYAKGFVRIASNNGLKNGYDLEIVNENTIVPVKIGDIFSLKYITKNDIKEYNISVNEDIALFSEEIVNAKHAGTMTKKEIKSRDKLAKKVKAKPIKGKDTEENAKYRLATFIELRKRGQEPKGKAPKKNKNKKKKNEDKK
jgi:hypothetical protein